MRPVLVALACILSLSSARPGAAQQAAPAPQVLRPGDLIHLRVSPDSTLSGEYQIESSGAVYLPLLGVIEAAGFTADQLRTILVERYSATVRNPVVVVSPRFRVSVLGAVGSPGLYFVDGTTDLLDVISRAGGFAPNADQSNVRVVRAAGTFNVDVESILSGAGPTTATPLYSGDRIVVPRRGGFNIQALQVVLQLAAVALGIINISR